MLPQDTGCQAQCYIIVSDARGADKGSWILLQDMPVGGSHTVRATVPG